MWIVRGLRSFAPDVAASVIARGTFDGVHLAHRAILDVAVARGRELGVPAVACTFEPHPMDVLQPGRAPLPIATLDDRLTWISEAGIDGTVVLEFTRALAAMEPEAFVKDVLLDSLHAREIVVGYNHTFGRGARGNAHLLDALGARFGFRTHVVPAYEVDGVPVSSSEIRAALQAGNVERAARFLGRPYAITGDVVAGAGRGRTLGFPTANVQPSLTPLIPAGVYACRVEFEREHHDAVVNVGVRPTFGEDTLCIEAHVLDFSGDLYGRRVRIAFLHHLRDETRFPSVDALRAQISRDIEQARRAL